MMTEDTITDEELAEIETHATPTEARLCKALREERAAVASHAAEIARLRRERIQGRGHGAAGLSTCRPPTCCSSRARIHGPAATSRKTIDRHHERISLR